jgi:predicted transcriptional regulator
MTDLEVAKDDLVRFSGKIAAAYVSHNTLSPADLPSLLQSVYVALVALGNSTAAAEPELVPAVPVRKSVAPDAIMCLECGKPFKAIKGHLQKSHELSPQEYRERWSLTRDYPMVAPTHSAKRSEMAKAIGLGRKGASASEKRR